jgi:hypothetical protein
MSTAKTNIMSRKYIIQSGACFRGDKCEVEFDYVASLKEAKRFDTFEEAEKDMKANKENWKEWGEKVILDPSYVDPSPTYIDPSPTFIVVSPIDVAGDTPSNPDYLCAPPSSYNGHRSQAHRFKSKDEAQAQIDNNAFGKKWGEYVEPWEGKEKVEKVEKVEELSLGRLLRQQDGKGDPPKDWHTLESYLEEFCTYTTTPTTTSLSNLQVATQ